MTVSLAEAVFFQVDATYGTEILTTAETNPVQPEYSHHDV